ncbi:hypothetical protein EYB53_014940 [Candidatus Chloroploca sp. M-50]|uniref:Uncharacterized protein n=1 Tax=Candidatus Chloroploca mongolica TaxID=2528176 RepID=A0ABS4DC38_9CHLR|nr:hypothetical protein [Candidatus Chloroploca mongolica]MBP1467008.1 hypothetical protein [Candidatus Chloroploca mongolica]
MKSGSADFSRLSKKPTSERTLRGIMYGPGGTSATYRLRENMQDNHASS